tara:strand:- start:883 stop:1446 length:564 start_codon:yes stop_codon:yes gene_type:complete
MEREINRGEFIEFLEPFVKGRDVDNWFILKGGTKFIKCLQGYFTEETNRTFEQLNIFAERRQINLSAGYKVVKIFICGVGWVEFQYDKKYDGSNSYGENLMNGFPKESYNGAIYNGGDDSHLGDISMLVNAVWEKWGVNKAQYRDMEEEMTAPWKTIVHSLLKYRPTQCLTIEQLIQQLKEAEQKLK